MSRIVWLASYPKSGNTWLRIFLANLLRAGSQPIDINEIATAGIASDRRQFDDASGIESSDMTQEEIERYRPEAYRYLAARSPETLYIKIHDAFTCTSAGEPLVPPEVSAGAIYLSRNPLDVAVSYADHFACSIDAAIARLGSETASLSADSGKLKMQLKQSLLSWSSHVSSWLDQRAIAVYLTRYEDMSIRPVETFSAIACFLGLPHDEERVRRAVQFASFEILREQEKAHGFKERSPNAARFFRQGQVGAWRSVLRREQVAKVLQDHGPTMRRLGYVCENEGFERPQ